MKMPSWLKLRELYPDLPTGTLRLIIRIGRCAEAKYCAYDARAHDPLQDLIEHDDRLAATAAWARQCFSSPFASQMWRVTMALHAIDVLVGGYGVEALGPDIGGMDPPPYEYINAGDTYDATLVYQRARDRLFISSWGDVAEKQGKHWK